MIDPLIERAQRGDRAAVEELLAGVAPAVRRFGMRMCGTAHDADDALQDALLAIATHLPEYDGRAAFTSWVFTLVRTACARRRRGLKNRPPVDDSTRPESVDEGVDPEQRAAGAELARALAAALDRLPEEQREVIHLRDVEGLSAAETAAAVGVSVEAVKSRLHRARVVVREALRPVLDDEAPPRSGCPDVMTWWSRRLEGEVTPRDCAAIDAHAAGCGSCAKACESLRRIIGACRDQAGRPLDAASQRAVRAAVRRVAEEARRGP